MKGMKFGFSQPELNFSISNCKDVSEITLKKLKTSPPIHKLFSKLWIYIFVDKMAADRQPLSWIHGMMCEQNGGVCC